MSTGTPTKPAGCFLQCCAIVPLLLMLGAFGTGQITLGILLFAAGIGLCGGAASRAGRKIHGPAHSARNRSKPEPSSAPTVGKNLLKIMTLPNPPHLYNPPDTRWWWFSWSGPSGRRRQSCQALGLSVDIPADQALEKVKEYLGLIPKSPDPGTETLGWLRTVIAKKPEPNITESTRGVYLRHFDIFIELLGDDFPLSNVKRIPHVARFQEFLLHTPDGVRSRPISSAGRCRRYSSARSNSDIWNSIPLPGFPVSASQTAS